MGDIGQGWSDHSDICETHRNQITRCYINWFCICHVYIANDIYQCMTQWLFEKMHSRNTIKTKVQGNKCFSSETDMTFFLKNKII